MDAHELSAEKTADVLASDDIPVAEGVAEMRRIEGMTADAG